MAELSNAPVPSPEQLVDIYRRMIRIERNDDAIRKTIRLGRLQMPYYSARGQEVIPSTLSSLLTDDDKICTIYRGIHDMVAKDMPLRPLWAEIAGRVDGTCKGKGGPMHLTHPETGVMVTTGIVGSSMPIANGLGWAALLDGSKQVTIAYFGDGASNIGAFHESLNLASLWKLPVLFVCQNNGFAEHTRYENGTSVDFIAKRAAGYGMPGFTVDGNDPWAMFAAAQVAIERARAGEGPTLLECKTFRFLGHVFGDDDKYMTKEEKAAAMADDPLPKFRARLIAEGHATEEQLAALQADIEAEVADAQEFGLASAFPSTDELRRDVFAEEIAA
ncbi:thiamine pyrophosphate-dependent dehydrogenase E1 component subunit alpha [Sphingomonas oligophenolica]|uniref:Thiamine pyrophosphate-dependent dehydrogenase E1 component subunit alpha n=1 Tax=Sphingomonas oligophenolica TaxID=301154 RepID=A0ABU9XY89_9SPHN